MNRGNGWTRSPSALDSINFPPTSTPVRNEFLDFQRQPALFPASFIYVVIVSVGAAMAQLDSFEKHGLDNDAFGEKSTLSGLRTFDAFRRFISMGSRLCTTLTTKQPKLNRPIHLQPRQVENGRLPLSSSAPSSQSTNFELGFGVSKVTTFRSSKALAMSCNLILTLSWLCNVKIFMSTFKM